YLLPTPATAEHWLEILNEFDQQWNFPHCLRCQGRISDGAVFKNSLLWKNMVDDNLAFREPAVLPGQQKIVPNVILGDDAYVLHK
ncbi:hypothetical protein HUJ04_011029, partial [Dendroctonus ponderosae]